jgi:hypothetical protein
MSAPEEPYPSTGDVLRLPGMRQRHCSYDDDLEQLRDVLALSKVLTLSEEERAALTHDARVLVRRMARRDWPEGRRPASWDEEPWADPFPQL